MRLWQALLGASSVAPPRASNNVPVYATLRPLVGGPTWLPLHVQLACNGTIYDFLPESPTDALTTQTLLTGGACDGVIRIRRKSLDGERAAWRLLGYTTRESKELRSFAERQDSSLSLLSNNCFTFASMLAQYALVDEST